MSDRHILTVSCPNRAGIVAALSSRLFEGGANILESNQFDDVITGRFFMRVVYNFPGEAPADALRSEWVKAGEAFGADWTLRDAGQRQRVLLMVSAFDHCLADLIYRWRIGELPMDIAGIVSNHPKEALWRVNIDDIPFHHMKVTKENKAEQEARLDRIIEDGQVDLVVLARYMQILSDDFSQKLAGRCINIHHSFLPGFKGAKPYHQAHARGVKLIGATAHYVTAELDEGPIIEQDVERVSHQDSPDDLVRKGRDIERRVLSRAVAFHLAGRVMMNGDTTVVFRD
jgi:formyltetrahydrofolate deformylase